MLLSNISKDYYKNASWLHILHLATILGMCSTFCHGCALVWIVKQSRKTWGDGWQHLKFKFETHVFNDDVDWVDANEKGDANNDNAWLRDCMKEEWPESK